MKFRFVSFLFILPFGVNCLAQTTSAGVPEIEKIEKTNVQKVKPVKEVEVVEAKSYGNMNEQHNLGQKLEMQKKGENEHEMRSERYVELNAMREKEERELEGLLKTGKITKEEADQRRERISKLEVEIRNEERKEKMEEVERIDE